MNIYEKLTAIQNELKAPKSQRNAFGGYNYRNCEDILEALKPLLAKYKSACYLSNTTEIVGDRYYVKATALFVDCDSENTVISASASAREEETKKGMDGSQITGSASSYARKYALAGLFACDDTKDADSDEKSHNRKDRDALYDEASDIGINLDGVAKYFKTTVHDLTADQIAQAIAMKKK